MKADTRCDGPLDDTQELEVKVNATQMSFKLDQTCFIWGFDYNLTSYTFRKEKHWCLKTSITRGVKLNIEFEIQGLSWNYNWWDCRVKSPYKCSDNACSGNDWQPIPASPHTKNPQTKNIRA